MGRERLGKDPMSVFWKKQKERASQKRVHIRNEETGVVPSRHKKRSKTEIPNFVYELNKLTIAEGLSSALKEKKKRLLGQLAVFNKKRAEKGLPPINCNPLRIGDDEVLEDEVIKNEPKKELVKNAEEVTKVKAIPFGMAKEEVLARDIASCSNVSAPKFAFGVYSESEPSLRADRPEFIPSINVHKKKEEEDLEYERFLRSIT